MGERERNVNSTSRVGNEPQFKDLGAIAQERIDSLFWKAVRVAPPFHALPDF